jgi:hypothetical protein
VERRLRTLHHHSGAGGAITVEFDLGGLNSGGTGTGKVRIEIYPDWAPLGAKRFLDLVKDKYFSDHMDIFRVIPVSRLQSDRLSYSY